jgi:hypothetical protein
MTLAAVIGWLISWATEADIWPIVATRFACARSICNSRYRASLSRIASSAFLRSVKSTTKLTPSFLPPLNDRAADQHRRPPSAFSEVLFLVRLSNAGRVELGLTLCVCFPPFGGRQLPPVQPTQIEVVAIISHEAKKGFVRISDATVRTPEKDPNDIGVDQPPYLGLVLEDRHGAESSPVRSLPPRRVV